MPTPPPPPLGRFTSLGPAPTDPQLIVIETTDGDLLATEVVPIVDDDRPTIDELVELARRERELRRAEQHQRVAVIAVELEDEPWFAHPLVRLGTVALLGYALGRSRTLRVLASLTFGAALVASVDRALAHTAPVPAAW